MFLSISVTENSDREICVKMVFLILKITNDLEILPTLGGLLNKAYIVMLYEESEL